ncbi:MAG: NADH-ubiquinone oxidoreductase-F iron-sulfur binding region domain-containing protein [Rubrivivax sp.]
MGPLQLFVPRDAAANAVGVEAVAQALLALAAAQGRQLQPGDASTPLVQDTLVRNGSRGLCWLEPMVEVAAPHGRVAYGPVAVEDLPSLWPALLAEAAGQVLPGADASMGAHPLRLGLTEQLPALALQERLTFARVGVTDPLSLADYAAHGGWAGLRAALASTPEAVLHEVTHSGLRGRGGAAFPAGIKWKTVAQATAAQKYVVCNADEGDSGTFADRLVMEGDPYMLLEGLAIAGLAVGATQGYIYIRSEYPDAIAVVNEAIARATAAGWLGEHLQGSAHSFQVEVRKAAGAYVCGEETAMLESIEGQRGIVRAKPPLPALQGLFGQPTVVNNVLTLAAVPLILARGGEFYRGYGVGRSHGTLPFQLAGNVRHGGLVEKAFGLTLRELVFGFGGGTRSGRPVKAIQVGGPLGAYVPEAQWDLPLDYEVYAAHGLVLGHGGVVVHDDTANLAQLARYAMQFCAIESCGKCTPCRIGSTRGVEVMDRIIGPNGQPPAPAQRERQVALLRDLCDTMTHGSLCAMGGMTPFPVLSALNHYPQDFGLPAPAQAPTAAGLR